MGDGSWKKAEIPARAKNLVVNIRSRELYFEVAPAPVKKAAPKKKTTKPPKK